MHKTISSSSLLSVGCSTSLRLMWRLALQRISQQGTTKLRPPRRRVDDGSGVRLLSSAGNAGSRDDAVAASTPKDFVREATDTLDLIDELLGVLGHGESSSREPGFVFFDLDETLVTRDTCLIDGFDSTRSLMLNLEAKLGPSSEALRIIQQEMENDYYNADSRLVDPLLARVIRALKIQGHSVFGLTSNSLNNVHSPKILETLAKYKIRFSVPEVRGELPRSGALVMDHSVCRGVIFIDNQQTIPHDKGEVIAEYVSLLLQTAAHKTSPVTGSSFSSSSRLLPPIGGVGMASPLENLASSVAAAAAAGITPENGMHMKDGGGGGGRRGQYSRGSSTSLESIPVEPTAAQPLQQRKRKCVLVDNTSRKCERAVTSFAKMGLKSLELHTVHFTEAERQVGSPEALVQLSRILSRLRAQGQIGEDLLVDGITTQAPQVPQVGETAAAAAVLSGGNAKPQLGALRSGRNRMGSSTERCGTLPPKRDGSLGPSPVFET